MELLSMERALLSSSIMAITSRCESGYRWPFHSFNCLHSITTPLRMEEKGWPVYTPSLRAVHKMRQGDHAPKDSNSSQAWQVEKTLLSALLSLRERPNFEDIVSTSNDSSQTFAHLSVLYGYITLLERLVEWRIDLTVADTSGLTALHYAYLKEDRESIRILLSGGAPSSVEDRLGRRPRDVLPEGSDLADFPGEEIGIREGPPHIEHLKDHEIALGDQHAGLEAEAQEHHSPVVYMGHDDRDMPSGRQNLPSMHHVPPPQAVRLTPQEIQPQGARHGLGRLTGTEKAELTSQSGKDGTPAPRRGGRKKKAKQTPTPTPVRPPPPSSASRTTSSSPTGYRGPDSYGARPRGPHQYPRPRYVESDRRGPPEPPAGLRPTFVQRGPPDDDYDEYGAVDALMALSSGARGHNHSSGVQGTHDSARDDYVPGRARREPQQYPGPRYVESDRRGPPEPPGTLRPTFTDDAIFTGDDDYDEHGAVGALIGLSSRAGWHNHSRGVEDTHDHKVPGRARN